MRCLSVWIVLAALLLVACGGGLAQRSTELLEREQQAMSDSELQGYYQQLSDQLAHETRAARRSTSRKRGATEEDNTIDLLRERWNEVRQEMRRRELLP
jgi:outer membrane PBP1 activator LpoA protein